MRAARLLLFASTVLSAMGAILSAALWARSYYVLDTISRSTPRGDTILQSHRGRLSWRATKWPEYPHLHVYVPGETRDRWLLGHWPQPATPPDYPDPGDTGVRRDWRFLGFALVRSDGSTTPPSTGSFSFSGSGQITYPASRGMTVPYAAMVVLLGLLPARGLLRARRRARARRRIAQGLCAACGYDRRATPAGGRCPECGVAPY